MEELLVKLKRNLILQHDADDQLLSDLLLSAIAYAEDYQKKTEGFYQQASMRPTTEQAVIMLASHWYESRDGSTAGFWNDNPNAAGAVMETVNRLLRLQKEFLI